MILRIFRPPRRLIVPPMRAEDGTFDGNGMPALWAAAMASSVDFSSSPGIWTCCSSSPSNSDLNEKWDDPESRRLEEDGREGLFVAVDGLRKDRSSPSTTKSSSSQFSMSASTGCLGLSRKGSMVVNVLLCAVRNLYAEAKVVQIVLVGLAVGDAVSIACSHYCQW